MNKSDLMVGNWVIYNPNKFINEEYDTPKPPYPCQIRNGEDIDLAETGCYSPIPLTPEIIARNFKKDDEWVNGYFLIDNVHIYKENEEGTWNIEYMELLQIKYVHQLQQALRICGIQKEIKL